MTHYIKGLYAADERGFDVIVLGGYTIFSAEGKSVSGPSAANYHFVQENGGLLIRRLEIYAVSMALDFRDRDNQTS